MRKINIKIIIILIIFFIFIFSGSSFIIPKFFRISPRIYQELNQLRLENQNLKTFSEIQPQKTGDFKIARIYSSYPFNNRNEFSIALGSQDGIRENSPAVIGENIILGKVIKVFKNYSNIQTIFDLNWHLSVRIGEIKASALLVGGSKPRLTMIDKNKSIKENDLIYSVNQGFPYGALIGKIGKIISSPSAIFQEAEIILPYDLNNIFEVKILIDYAS